MSFVDGQVSLLDAPVDPRFVGGEERDGRPVAEDYGARNFVNRTLWQMDNLLVLRGLNSGTVDLVYLDPPFNSRREYNAPAGSAAGGARFSDTWRLCDFKEELAELRAPRNDALLRVVEAAGAAHGDAMKAYLCFMAPRLREMWRVLKPTGSLYLHCDPTAGHYLKLLLDCVFGSAQFRNEIVWWYRGTGGPKRSFPSKHDKILFYARGEKNTFFPVEVDAAKRSGWTGKLTKRCDSVWQINTVFNSAERATRTGWPTQKPLALLNRIIRASCPEGGWVLDPFCGGGTALVAAENAGCRWVGADCDPAAGDFTLRHLRFNAQRLEMADGVDASVSVVLEPPVRSDRCAPRRTANLGQLLWERYASRGKLLCVGCYRRKFQDDFDVDHVVPLSRGGEDCDSNMHLLCRACNVRKGARLTMRGLWDVWGHSAAVCEELERVHIERRCAV